jgi:hypothetical protein
MSPEKLLKDIEEGILAHRYGKEELITDTLMYLVLRVKKTEHERDQALLGRSTHLDREAAVVRNLPDCFKH